MRRLAVVIFWWVLLAGCRQGPTQAPVRPVAAPPAVAPRAKAPAGTAVAKAPAGGEALAAGGGVTITWLGHACFLLKDSKGTAVVTDPFNADVGYPLPRVQAKVVLISHDHFDHNNSGVIGGAPKVLPIVREGIPISVAVDQAGLTFTAVPVYHDEHKGADRGPNTIYIWEMDGLRFCHAGDLGHTLDAEQIKAVGKVDVLMIPVGGFFTIDANKAATVAEQLKAKIVFPMHYKTALLARNLASKLAPVDDFVAVMRGQAEIQQEAGNSVTVSSKDVQGAKVRVIVLAPQAAR